MDRDDMLQIKEESEDTEIDIGPTILEEIDSHYNINQPDINADKQESTSDNNNVDPILSSGVKRESNEMELTGAEGQRLAQATLAPAGAGSVKQRIHITVEDTKLVIAPIQHSINQQNTIVVKRKRKIAHDVNDPVLCSRVKEETGEDKHGVSPIINRCDRCWMIFSSEKKLNTHLRNMHYIYRCSVCKVDFRNKPGLPTHMKLMHPEEEYEVTPSVNRCFFCKKIYSTQHNLAIHITNMHRTGSYYECFECKMEFESEAYLQTHMKLVHFSGVHRLLKQGQNQQSSRSNTVEDSSVSTHPPVDEVNAAASASTPQQNAVVTKEELADEELELGPVVFQHMDSNYRPYKEESLPD